MARIATIGVGDPAPDFAAPSKGGIVRLSDYRGKHPVVLYFYPRDHTSVCTAQACSFRDHLESFRAAGAVVIGVSGDSIASHERFAGKHALPFPLVSDADGSIRRLYGVPKLLGLIPSRVTFVIDREGIVRSVYSALFESERHALEAIAALERISAAQSEAGRA